jgi:hypothetical protein
MKIVRRKQGLLLFHDPEFFFERTTDRAMLVATRVVDGLHMTTRT